MKPQDTQSILLSLANFIEDNQEKILKLESNALISISADLCKYYSGACRNLIAVPQHEYFKTCTSSMRWEPKGHCLGVIPSNYPLVISLWKIAPALAAGCTIDIKLNPKNLGSLPWILSNWKNKYNSIKIIDTIDFEKYDFIDVTGSETTARYFKNNHYDVNADIGGASIAVINDGNIDFILKSLEWSINYNNGADCTSPKHIFTVNKFYKDILKIKNTLADSCKNIDHFLPMASVSVYEDIHELINEVNKLKNRLGLHLYTNELKIQRFVSEHARWGTIFVNKPLAVPVEMPHSGLGLSGNTFNQSFFKIYQYLVPKHIVIGDQND
jgi:acyl-CoA reductase-like NAD-dependent aldehyde dehydrogenase